MSTRADMAVFLKSISPRRPKDGGPIVRSLSEVGANERRNQGILLAKENALNSFERAAHNVRQLNERWNNRFTFHKQSLVEQYRHGRIALICDLDISTAKAFADTEVTFREHPSSNANRFATLIFNANVINLRDVQDWKQKPVLVENVEIVQGTDGVIPSLVRFYDIHDEVRDCLGGWAYCSAIDGCYKFIPGIGDRESSVFVPPVSSPKDNFINGQVQRPPEIVEGISEDERKLLWKGLSYNYLKNIISSLKITLNAETVGVICGEGKNSFVKVIDVLFGPFNL